MYLQTWIIRYRPNGPLIFLHILSFYIATNTRSVKIANDWGFELLGSLGLEASTLQAVLRSPSLQKLT